MEPIEDREWGGLISSCYHLHAALTKKSESKEKEREIAAVIRFRFISLAFDTNQFIYCSMEWTYWILAFHAERFLSIVVDN